MIAVLRLDGIDAWQLAGWTMLHFLWLGTLAALAAGACRLVLRRASANVRYAVAIVCLAVLAALPVGIGVWVGAKPQAMRFVGIPANVPSAAVTPTAPAGHPAAGSAGGLLGVELLKSPTNTLPAHEPETLAIPITNSNPRQSRGLANVFASAAEYLPWAWIIGTPLTFVLLATGVVGAERLRRTSRVIDDGPIAEACARLVESLRIGRRVTIAVCERIAAPVLVGIVRPIILLPPAALTGWSPDEIEMVLLHELAHVRRWDNLVNLLQRTIESLLFFHPAVWLVSNWVRREREACCDAVVVGRTNQPHAYAEMLVEFATRLSEPSEPGRPRPSSSAFRRSQARPSSLVSSAMAAGPLRGRIRQILGLQDDPMLISGKSLGVVMSGLLLVATLVVLNLPTRSEAEESTPEIAKSLEKTDASVRDAGEDRAATQNNLKHLALVFLNHNESRLTFPAVASFDSNGKPLLSWRVHVLPYLDEEALFKKFHLDEPWDSEHNRKLIAEMPDVFKNPRIDRPGFTNYLAVVGSECMFDGTAQGIRLSQVTDGTANTIALVEADADQAVEWTKPQDWEFDRNQPTAGLGSLWPGHWYAARVDGSVSRIENGKPADELGILFTRAGEESKSLIESAGERGLDGDELGFGGAKPAPQPVDKFRAKFLPSDTNRYETRVYEITDAPNAKIRLDWIVEMLKRDPSDPKPSFGYNWTNDWTRLEIIAPTQGQEFVEPLIKATQSASKAGNINSGEAKTLAISSLVNVPYVVGTSRFADGDKITITEVRGTADTFEPGNVYHIQGTYTLASRDSAKLSAFTTAKNPADGKSPIQSMQTTKIRRGSGEFTLTLPMTVRGWPHVSFYPAEGGEGFGGIYFGTGDSVLEKWWGPNEVIDTTGAANDSENRRGKFPSLEEQKLADAAYKRLGLELEAIGDEDLKRVRALGYDGGLKITQNDGSVISWETRLGGILPSDILVGLHAWPTKSIKDVLDILQRDDLAELNPLKFYIVRPQVDGTNPVHDSLITGRISVSPEKPAARYPGSAAAELTEQTRVVAATQVPIPLGSMKSSATDAPIDELVDEALAADPNMAMMNQELMQLEYQLRAQGLKQRHSAKSDHLAALIAAKQQAIAEYRRQLREQLRGAQKSQGLPHPTIPNAFEPISRIPATQPKMLRIEVDPREIALDPNLQGPKPDRWLPPPALAAPAPDPLTEREKQQLKTAGGVRIEFYYHPQSDPCIMAAKLIPKYEKEFAGLVKVERINVAENPAAAKVADVDRVPTFKLYLGDRPVLDRTGEMTVEQLDYTLASIARHEAYEPQVSMVKAQTELRYDGRTFGQWQMDFGNRGSREAQALRALEAFAAAGYGLEAARTILDGAFSPSDAIAKRSRKFLSKLPASEAEPIVAQLAVILETELSTNRRIDAIRALAAVGPPANSALDILNERLASSNQRERIAAAAAIKMIVGKDQYQKPVADVLGEELGIDAVESNGVWAAVPRKDAKDDGKAFNDFTDAVIKEQEQLFPDGRF